MKAMAFEICKSFNSPWRQLTDAYVTLPDKVSMTGKFRLTICPAIVLFFTLASRPHSPPKKHKKERQVKDDIEP